MQFNILTAGLLTLLFFLIKLSVDLIVYSFSFSRSQELQSHFFKLLLSAGFLAAPGAIFLVHTAFLRLRAYASIDSLRDLPRLSIRQMIGKSTATPLEWLLFLIFLPVPLQILGSELDVISRTLFGCNEQYEQLLGMFLPTGDPIDTIGAWISIGLIGPVAEELFFRGYLLGALLNRYRSVPLAIAVQALLFAAIHANRWQFLFALLSALFFGYLRVRTASLLPPLLLHIGNNGIVVATHYHLQGLFPITVARCEPIEHLPIFLTGAAILALFVVSGFIHRRYGEINIAADR